jgi:hypothetical protein
MIKRYFSSLGQGQTEYPNNTSTGGRSSQSPQGKRRLHQLSLLAPFYESIPYWDLEPVLPSESLPGQRYRLTLVHGTLKRAIPIQLHPGEGDRLLAAVRVLDCDWALDIDGTGQLCCVGAAAVLGELLGAIFGGEADA